MRSTGRNCKYSARSSLVHGHVYVIFINVLQRCHYTIEDDRGHAESFSVGPWSRGCEACGYDTEGHSEHQQPL